MKNRVFLGLGSNVGDRAGNLVKAIDLLEDKVKILKTSRVYVSAPVGYTRQDLFLNMAVYGQTGLDLISLLEFVKEVERKVGRVERFRWGPREIDIDILFFNDEVYVSDVVTVPHPRLHERDFVLVPLMDLDPEFVHPVTGRKVRELLSEVKEESILKVE